MLLDTFLLSCDLDLHQLVPGEKCGRNALSITLLSSDEDVFHALQHLVGWYEQILNNIVHSSSGRNVVSREDLIERIQSSDRDQSPLLIWPVLLSCLDSGVHLVLSSKLKYFAN